MKIIDDFIFINLIFMRMKKLLQFLIFVFMFGLAINSFAQGDCEIPANFIQNPNFEHRLNPIFWYGSWDWVWWNLAQEYNSIVSHPEFWVTDTTEVHSGNNCMVLTYDSYIWPTVTTVGFEEKDMRMSFWYKSPVSNMAFWMFFYRDAGLSPADIRAPIPAAYVGYDTAYVAQIQQGDVWIDQSLYFEMWGPYPDWTYFEFTWSYPGAGSFTSGWPAVTLMFWSEETPGFVDDIYYGLDFDPDCQYVGQEEIEIKNADFEDASLGYEWALNIWIDEDIGALSIDENRTDNGVQSLRLYDPYNATYYMPAMGTEGENMELSFWHKGHNGTLELFFYDDYDVTTGEFPLPEGASYVVDSVLEYVIDTVDIIIDTVEVVIDTTQVIDTITAVFKTLLGEQNFDDPGDLSLPGDGDWLWSNSGYYIWDDWSSGVKDDYAYSDPNSFWLPGDPAWTGAAGFIGGIVDDTTYMWSFMYSGKLQFQLYLGSSLKYDLVGDPDGIVPANATADADAITWQLESSSWNRFEFVYDQGSWLADSSVASPATLEFWFVGTYVDGDVGYVDNLAVGTAEYLPSPDIDTSLYIDTTYTIEEAYVIDTTDEYYAHIRQRASWDLPAADDWTEFSLNWTNPSGDIGSTLTMILLAGEGTATDSLIYFDDFYYGLEPTSVGPVREFNKLHTYPNPVEDVLYLSLKDPLSQIVIYNSLGQIVKTVNNPYSKIDVSGLKSGIYMLNAVDRKGIYYKSKFIKL